MVYLPTFRLIFMEKLVAKYTYHYPIDSLSAVY